MKESSFNYSLPDNLNDTHIHISLSGMLRALCGVQVSYAVMETPPEITLCYSCKYIRDSILRNEKDGYKHE